MHTLFFLFQSLFHADSCYVRRPVVPYAVFGTFMQAVTILWRPRRKQDSASYIGTRDLLGLINFFPENSG